MKLHDYLDLGGIRVTEFARRLDVTPNAVWRWLNGTRAPGHDEMRKIYEATGRLVSPNDWILPEENERGD